MRPPTLSAISSFSPHQTSPQHDPALALSISHTRLAPAVKLVPVEFLHTPHCSRSTCRRGAALLVPPAPWQDSNWSSPSALLA